jgi:putative restriction endonuclease
MPRHGEDWSREELILAFALYSETPFGKIHMTNPRIVELSRLLGRTPGAVSMKLSNFARLDPALQARGIRGLTRGAKAEDGIWAEFAANPEALAYESQALLATKLGASVEEVAQIETDDLPRQGLERQALVKVRVNQSFFRRRILSAYNFRCCVTGIAIPELLVASHIAPWSLDIRNRLNTRNGLCLNPLHDRVFDRHLMSVDGDLRIHFSARLQVHQKKENERLSWLLSFEGKQLILPKHFAPDPDLLAAHGRLLHT